MKKSICNFSKVLVLVLLVGLSACSKDEKAPNKRTLLTAQKWELTGVKYSDKEIIDTKDVGEIYHFMDDGTFKIFYTKNTYTDEWILEGDKIIITPKGLDSDTLTIEKLDQKSLIFTHSIEYGKDEVKSIDETMYFKKH